MFNLKYILLIITVLSLSKAYSMMFFEVGTKNITTLTKKIRGFHYFDSFSNQTKENNVYNKFKNINYFSRQYFSTYPKTRKINVFSVIKSHPYLKFFLFGTTGFFLYKYNEKPEPLKGMILEGYEKAKYARDKDVIFVIGNTGSGKSTTVAYLMGAKIKQEIAEENGKLVAVIDGDNTGYPTIGHTFQSETLYPQIYKTPNEIFLCDCPGFFDTRSENEKIAISANMELVLEAAKNKKVMILASYDEFTAQRGESFKKVISLLELIFKDPDYMSSSIVWGITKAPSQLTSEHILKEIHGEQGLINYNVNNLSKLSNPSNYIKDDKENINEKTIKRQLRILESITKDNLVLIDPYNDNSKKEVLECIKKSNGLRSDQFCFDQDESRKNFKNYALGIANNITELLNQRLEILDSNKYWYEQILVVEDKIKTCSSDKKRLQETKINNNKLIEDKISKNQEEKQQKEKRRSTLNEELYELDTNEEILIHYDYFQEKKSLVWTSAKQFTYSGEPFSTVNLERNRCGTANEIIKPLEGFYKAEYKGGWCDSDVTLKIFVKKKDRMINKQRIKQINDELVQIKKYLRTLEDIKYEKENEIKELQRSYKFNLQKIEQEEQMLIEHKQSINEKLDQNEELMLKIDNRIKDEKYKFYSTHKVVAILPKTSETPLITQFNKLVLQLRMSENNRDWDLLHKRVKNVLEFVNHYQLQVGSFYWRLQSRFND